MGYESFDVVKKVRELDKRVAALESGAPSANMDAAVQGATLDALPKRLRASLEMAGYATPYLLRQMSDEDMQAIEGVGAASVRLIRAALG